MIVLSRKFQDVELPNVSIGIEGWFTVELIHAATGLIKQRLRFKNIITNAGFDAMGNASFILSTAVNYIAVGTGSSTPTVLQTALDAELGRTNNNNSTADVITAGPANAYWSLVRTRQFLQAEVNGNLTELGFFNTNPAGTMWNRQLFKVAGVPTTIVKTSADFLRITYEYRIYSPSADISNTVTISGVGYPYTIRAININQANTWGFDGSSSGPLNGFGQPWPQLSQAYESNVLVSQTGGNPSGTPQTDSSRAASAYTNGSFQRAISHTYGTATGNFTTGIGSIVLNGRYAGGAILPAFQCAFTTTKLPKDNTKQLVFNSTFSWAAV